MQRTPMHTKPVSNERDHAVVKNNNNTKTAPESRMEALSNLHPLLIFSAMVAEKTPKVMELVPKQFVDTDR